MSPVFETMKAIVDNYGADILQNPSRCYAIMSDLMAKHKTEVDLISIALTEGIGSKLIDANQSSTPSKEKVVKKAIDELVNSASMDRSRAEEAVCYLTYALGWNLKPQEHTTATKVPANKTTGTTFTGFSNKANAPRDLLKEVTQLKSTTSPSSNQSTTPTSKMPYQVKSAKPKKKVGRAIFLVFLLVLIGGMYTSTRIEIPWVSEKVELLIDTAIEYYELAKEYIASMIDTGEEKPNSIISSTSNPSSSSKNSEEYSVGYVTTTGNVNVRSGPGTNYEQITVLNKGTTVEYAGETKLDARSVAWYKVKISSTETGWLSSKYAILKTETINKESQTSSIVHETIDWSSPYATIKSKGNSNPDYGTELDANMVDKVLKVQDTTGGWFRLSAPREGDYVFAVLSSDINSESFRIEVFVDGQHSASLLYKKTDSVQYGIIEGVKKGQVITWWDNDNSGKYWTFKEPFKLMISIQ